MMAPITAVFYVLKAIVLTPYVIETSADFQAKGARGSLNHHCTPRCSKAWSAFKDEITDAIVTKHYWSLQSRQNFLA